MDSLRSKIIREKILSLVKDYYNESFCIRDEFIPGESLINYGGRYFDQNEIVNLVDSSLDFWLTSGKWVDQFEKKFAQWLGIKYCLTTNSGSSANLLAFSALSSPLLKERAIKPGEEVITVSACFPTTVAPIVQFGAVPVFVDVSAPGYNIDVNQLEDAYSPKVKAVMLAHSLGNPFNVSAVLSFCKKYGLWLVEDNCDSLGSEYTMNGITKKTGTWGDIGTSSFYPAHHITMGEGGAVYTDNPLLYKILRSLRDWGRDCCCPCGMDNTCNARFERKYGELPSGYDHKYVYSHFGFNLKITEMQAAIGCAQLEKLDYIITERRNNHRRIYEGLKDLPYFILPLPEKDSVPSWFGFLLVLDHCAPFSRNEITGYLEKNGIQTRNFFAGNFLRHPTFNGMRKRGQGFRAVNSLPNTDYIMNNGFWLGVYPGIDTEKIKWIVNCITRFCNEYSSCDD